MTSLQKRSYGKRQMPTNMQFDANTCIPYFRNRNVFKKHLPLGNLSYCVVSKLKNLFSSLTSSIFFASALFVFILLNQSSRASAQPMGTQDRCNHNRNSTERICRDGVFLPVWPPANTSLLTPGDMVGKAIFYLLCLAFLFLGVSIIADRFMASIEVITSKEKEVAYKTKSGKKVVTTVRIWNETVSNLTLMALGSSAPEIMLSIIEICGRGFCAGDLGPSTIVGSASFNLFIIIAVCMYVIPDGEVRKVKHPLVFFVTAVWSVLAYIWLYFILAVFSRGVVEIWEGVVTFLFFPILVLFAWVADRRLLIYKLMPKRYRSRRRNVIVETEGDPDQKSPHSNNFHMAVIENGVLADDDTPATNQQSYSLRREEEEELLVDHETYRKELITLMKDLKKANPDADMDEIARLARNQVIKSQPKSRAFYRIQATRKMTGAGNILNKGRLSSLTASQSLLDFKDDANDSIARVFFDPPEYKVLENCGSVELNVVRRGGNLQSTLFVDYKTEDGTANAGSDYVATEDTIVFRPGESIKKIKIKIIDDDIFEEDEFFTVKLLNVRLGTIDGMFDTDENSTLLAKRETPFVARVIILDDDHAGVFSFESEVITVSESVGILKVEVQRNSGSRGKVLVPYKTVNGTARGGGVDFEDAAGQLEFDNDEISTSPICVEIVDNNKYNSVASFSIILEEPYYETNILDGSEGELLTEEQRRIAELGKPRLGDFPKLDVIIEESYEFKNTVDKLIKKANLAVVVGSSSWREQFADALSVNGGGDNNADDNAPPTKFDYVMHYLTVFWKLLFAFVPPTDYFGGWACFTFSIIVIGLLTAVIGDVASHFGCIVNLNDAVTAVTLVAMGTSVPDTFASKVAAIGDQYADASIGNVTGSNAVNVFLGIGIAWTVAAIYWAVTGENEEARKFHVPPGNLAFSVTVFFVFAVVAFLILVYRRRSPTIRGELGGPRPQKIISSIVFVMLWLLYILLATLDSYDVISTF